MERKLLMREIADTVIHSLRLVSYTTEPMVRWCPR